MVSIKDITDKKIWESFLINEYKGNYPFFQSWNWGEVENSLGHPVYRVGLYHHDKLVGVCQIVDVHAKRGHYLYLRHGPVIPKFTAAIADALLTYAKNLALQKGASFIRVSRFPLSEDAKTFFKEKGFLPAAIQTVDAEFCWTLDLTQSEDELLKQMRKSHRYLVRKALGMNIEVIKSNNVQDLDQFLPLYKHLSERKHFVAHRGLREEFETFAKDNEALLFLAKYEDKIIAGAFIDFVGNTAVYHHGSSDATYRNIPASYVLQWEAIKEAKKRGKLVYNFWGIAPPNTPKHPWNSITLFKTGFGGDYEYFLPTIDLPLNIFYWKNYLIDWISAKRKK